jgi:hypothetical protein
MTPRRKLLNPPHIEANGHRLFLFVWLSARGSPGSLGTGSYPPLENGLHRITRHTAIAPPFIAPKRSIASIAYSEHVGTNLHDGLSPGLTRRL